MCMGPIPVLFGTMSSWRPEMRGRRAVGELLICTVMAVGLKAASAQADDLFVMRTHLECGWFIQLSEGTDNSIPDRAKYHIQQGGRMAADLELSRERLAVEVTEASARALSGFDRSGYTESMGEACFSLGD